MSTFGRSFSEFVRSPIYKGAGAIHVQIFLFHFRKVACMAHFSPLASRSILARTGPFQASLLNKTGRAILPLTV